MRMLIPVGVDDSIDVDDWDGCAYIFFGERADHKRYIYNLKQLYSSTWPHMGTNNVLFHTVKGMQIIFSVLININIIHDLDNKVALAQCSFS